MELDDKKITSLLGKVKRAKGGQLDLSSDEDLSVAVMNLVSIEEHFFFTAAKTGKSEYLDLLAQVREIRKSLLKKLLKDPEGEVWCISKHLLAASMRLMEVGTKYYGRKKNREAKEMFQRAYELYSLFWGINLGLIKTGQIKEVGDHQLNVHNKDAKTGLSKLGGLIKKIIDCCIE